MTMIRVQTPPCILCGQSTVMEVSEDAFYRWRNPNGLNIQDAFPFLNADERELLKTGTHPACWDQITATGEED